MASTREMRLRIKSVKSIAQVTRALETVSASYVRKAVQAVQATEPYSEKAWKVVLHLARQPGRDSLHPLLKARSKIDKTLIIMVSGDRGLAGAYNVNIVRKTLDFAESLSEPITFIPVGKKGRDMLLRRRKESLGEFHSLPTPVKFNDTSAIGYMAVDEYLNDRVDQVYIAYTRYDNMIKQTPIVRKLLPLEIEYKKEDEHSLTKTSPSKAVFIYEPSQVEILEEIVPRFTQLQIYQSILSSQASEQAARMVAMRNASDNAQELIAALQLEYNKVRQQVITNDMLDISGGAEALSKVISEK
ncbi:MAG: ATP synthase F1 subunit gamma [Anaerolineaceae bacterium]|nr:ATP synthase F1 subunit gamma [Anaerolineaceae bacterium]